MQRRDTGKMSDESETTGMTGDDALRKILGLLDVLSVQLGETQASVARLETRFDALETRFDTLETRFDALETRFDRLETRFDRLEGRFDRFEARFDRLEGRFGGMETELRIHRTQSDARLASIEAR
jgi:predicted nuclease with TOPRIM domain